MQHRIGLKLTDHIQMYQFNHTSVLMKKIKYSTLNHFLPKSTIEIIQKATKYI